MLNLTINPLVLKKLQLAFPKPANAASKSLEAYRLLLLDILNDASQHQRPAMDVLCNRYVADVRRLSQKGPRIGPNKVRLHAWLSENNLSLIEFVTKGSNLTKLRSKIKLSALATLSNPMAEISVHLREAQTDAEIDQILDGTHAERHALFERLYPDFFELSNKARSAAYEFVPVDVASLRAYVYWLNTNATRISSASVHAKTQQAMQVLRVALHAKGRYPQKRKPSEFGRMYYEGLSVQNVPKELRFAMLGDCWEYDIRSSVIAFKLGFAAEILYQNNCQEDARRVFAMSHWYVEHKASMIAEIQRETFGTSSDLSHERQFELIKRSLTAIGFGASAREIGWKTEAGDWKNSSIGEILKNPQERSRFLNYYAVDYFVQEQAIFDEHIVQYIKKNRPDLWHSDLVKSGKSTSSAKVVALIYQHVETIAMDAARRAIRAQGNTVLASIHDAVIVKRRIGSDDLSDVIGAMRDETGNPYLHLKGTKYERYKRYSIGADAGIDLRYTVDELIKALKVSYPNEEIPKRFDFNSCLKGN